jgi:cytochrome c oxidase subunit 2
VTHHVLAPAADQAQAIATVWHAMFLPSLAIYVAVLAALAWAMWRRRAGDPASAMEARNVRRWSIALVGWTVFIATMLTAFTAVSFVQDRRLQAREADALRVRVTGRQWWWEVEYPDDADPSRQVTTANELHLPLGRMARIELQSGDVIHSLWIPALNGKTDLIPGRRTELAITPRKVGRYLGECAEFCGVQHAHMALPVTVESPQRFAAWLDARRATAAPPASPSALRGQQVFESRSCALCHAVSGTDASAQSAPDLTHLASRPTLAAGTLPNDRAHLLAWLADPQAHKPGTNMPDPKLSPDELADVVDYLEGLR